MAVNPAPAAQNHIGNVSLAAGVIPSPEGTASDSSWHNDNGKKVSLSDLRGKTVLINFWATWCGPCKAELPDIEAISKEYASKGLVVIGVSEDEGNNLVSTVSKFATQQGLTYQIVIDDNSIADAYGNINAIPTSFLVGKDGKIVKQWVGEKDRAFFESVVKKYLD
ncbi:MAG: TlpA family protein disulfide reductase [Bacteroidetes bacterium]|nr:TlpA family protein disulfide reductase [Bacteroidota bacterium]